MENEKEKYISYKSFIIIAICSFTFFSLCRLPGQKIRVNAKKYESFSNLKNIVLAMKDYANSDAKRGLMPYPVAMGSVDPLPNWGETKECWSPEIVKLLFKSHNLSKGDEKILISRGITGGEYEAMELSVDLAAGGNDMKTRWETDAELHYNVYCSKGLTNAASGNMVIGISYDQPDINNCLFNGEGWVVFLMDGSGGFKKRKFFDHYDFDDHNKILIEKMAKEKILKKIKTIEPEAKLRKVFGVNGNGGSTEIIGRKTSSSYYQTFVDD